MIGDVVLAVLASRPDGERWYVYELAPLVCLSYGSLGSMFRRLRNEGLLDGGELEEGTFKELRRPPRLYYWLTPEGRAAAVVAQVRVVRLVDSLGRLGVV
jgi:DNA-binding PadR family transcriptional regulator